MDTDREEDIELHLKSASFLASCSPLQPAEMSERLRVMSWVTFAMETKQILP